MARRMDFRNFEISTFLFLLFGVFGQQKKFEIQIHSWFYAWCCSFEKTKTNLILSLFISISFRYYYCCFAFWFVFSLVPLVCRALIISCACYFSSSLHLPSVSVANCTRHMYRHTHKPNQSVHSCVLLWLHAITITSYVPRIKNISWKTCLSRVHTHHTLNTEYIIYQCDDRCDAYEFQIDAHDRMWCVLVHLLDRKHDRERSKRRFFAHTLRLLDLGGNNKECVPKRRRHMIVCLD